MAGFGDNIFGDGPFGDADWSNFVFSKLIPPIYLESDIDSGGHLMALIDSLTGTFDYIKNKITYIGNLRDPLLVQTENQFTRAVSIVWAQDLSDGTSRVFLSPGSDGSQFDEVRPNYFLKDQNLDSYRILSINSSDRLEDLDDVPFDPLVNSDISKNIIVSGIPLADGWQPPTVFPVATPIINGSNTGPYSIVLKYHPISRNAVTINWTESAVAKQGIFKSDGTPIGDFGSGSMVNFDNGNITFSTATPVDSASASILYTTRYIKEAPIGVVPIVDGSNTGPFLFTTTRVPVNAFVYLEWTQSSVAKTGRFLLTGAPDLTTNLAAGSSFDFSTGNIVLDNSGAVIDIDSLFVYYIPIDLAAAVITGIDCLSILALDYGISVDKNYSEQYQRALVYNIYQLWDIKGSGLSYEILGKYFGCYIDATRLYRLETVGTLRLEDVDDQLFVRSMLPFPGDYITENPGVDIFSTISPTPNGVSSGPFVIESAGAPFYYYEIPPYIGGIPSDPDQFMDDPSLADSADPTPNMLGGFVLVEFSILGKPCWMKKWPNGTVTVSGTDVDYTTFNISPDIGEISVQFTTAKPDAGSVRITYKNIHYYTDISPETAIFDDVIADVSLPDVYAFDNDFNKLNQPIQVVSNAFVRPYGVFQPRYGTDGMYEHIVTISSDHHKDVFHRGTMFDDDDNVAKILSVTKLSSTSFRILAVNFIDVGVNNRSIDWFVIKNLRDNIIDENPGTTTGSIITPTENGVALVFTIQLANHPLDSKALTLKWKESTVAKTAILSGTTTVGGANGGNISSASINRTTGVLSITFGATHAPDLDSVLISYSPVADLAIGGSDITAVDVPNSAYTGIRYKLRSTFPDRLAVGNVGDWKIIDSNGKQVWIEQIELLSELPYVYDIYFISDSPLAIGPANIFYDAPEVSNCNFCAASVLHIDIAPIDINNTSISFTKLVDYINLLVPAHIKKIRYVMHNHT